MGCRYKQKTLTDKQRDSKKYHVDVEWMLQKAEKRKKTLKKFELLKEQKK